MVCISTSFKKTHTYKQSESQKIGQKKKKKFINPCSGFQGKVFLPNITIVILLLWDTLLSKEFGTLRNKVKHICFSGTPQAFSIRRCTMNHEKTEMVCKSFSFSVDYGTYSSWSILRDWYSEK